MPRVKGFAGLALLPALALVLVMGGCGGAEPNLDPALGERQKQGRIAAYGNAGYVSERGPSSAAGGGAQGAARSKAAQSGRR